MKWTLFAATAAVVVAGIIYFTEARRVLIFWIKEIGHAYPRAT